MHSRLRPIKLMTIALALAAGPSCGTQAGAFDWSFLFNGRWVVTLPGSSTHCIEIADGRVTTEYIACQTPAAVSDATLISTNLQTITFAFTQTETIDGKPTTARLSFIGVFQADGSIGGTVTVFADKDGNADSDAGAFIMRRSF